MPFQEINLTNPIEIDGKIVYPTTLSLHWSPGGDGIIQFGVTMDIDMALEHIKLVKEHSPSDKTVQFFSYDLSRPDMQRWVRFGRTARNAVHGADE